LRKASSRSIRSLLWPLLDAHLGLPAATQAQCQGMFAADLWCLLHCWVCVPQVVSNCLLCQPKHDFRWHAL
jgi:hypothetical protein